MALVTNCIIGNLSRKAKARLPLLQYWYCTISAVPVLHHHHSTSTITTVQVPSQQYQYRISCSFHCRRHSNSCILVTTQGSFIPSGNPVSGPRLIQDWMRAGGFTHYVVIDIQVQSNFMPVTFSFLYLIFKEVF